jgi:biogenesis of lysosome-related organelles complex 1 subunit 2
MSQEMKKSSAEEASGAEKETSQTSEERVASLTKELFHKTSDYVEAELEVTQDDYKLLEQMNRRTAVKYSQVKEVAQGLNNSLVDLEVNYARILPYLDKVDVLERKISRLEELAYSVDNYSKRLETKFKSLEKR